MGEIMSVSKEGRFPQAKHNPNEPLWTTGFYSIAGGIFFNQFPAYTQPYQGYMLIGLGAATIAFDTYQKFFRKEDKLIKNMGLKNKDGEHPVLIRKQQIDNGTNYVYSLPMGMSLSDFKAKKEAFENYHRVDNVEIGYNGGQVVVKTIEKEVEKFIPYEFQKTDHPLDLLVGKSMKKLEFLHLGDENPHLLIAGETGSGKSVCLCTTITNMILNAEQSDDKLELYLVDLKYGVEFRTFSKSKYTHAFITSLEKVDRLFTILNTEMKRRYQKLYEKEVANIKDYNKKSNDKMSYKVVFIDEFADLMMADKNLLQKLQSLTQKARAVGIHLVIATQRPSVDVITGIIKANIPCRIGLKTASYTDSRIIIDDESVRLDKLRGQGHCIVKGNLKNGNKNINEIQQMYLSLESAKKMIEHTFVVKEEPREEVEEVVPIVEERANKKKTKRKPRTNKKSGEVENIEL